MGKKILLTGGSGLVGSYLIDVLLRDGYELFLLVRSDKLNEYDGKVTVIEVDFATDWDLNKLPADLYAIIHLSQAENFRDFPAKAKEVFYINTLSTLKLIDFATKNKVSHFIYASSGGVYGTDGIFTEQQGAAYKREMGFYLGTKYCSEVVLDNYHDLLNVIILRFFFIYGKGQNQTMLIPRLINKVKQEEPIVLEGSDGLKINPVHAADAASAIVASLKLKGSHTFNVAGAEVLSLREICESVGRAISKTPRFEIDDKKTEKQLIGDISKMKELLVTPSISFDEGIKTLI
jgi:nucleoside-diphosphate-sugar epimerase